MNGRLPPQHPLDRPWTWLLVQFGELAIAAAVLGRVVPATWSLQAKIAALAAAMVVLTLINLRVRRFLARSVGASPTSEGAARTG